MEVVEAFIPKAAWAKTFEGYTIVDVALRGNGYVYLLLRQVLPEEESSSLWDFEIPTRLAVIGLDRAEPMKRLAHQGLADFRRPICGVSIRPIAQGMAVASNGSVYATGSKKSGIERVVEGDKPAGLTKIRCLFGYAYAVGLHREVFRRTDVGKWERLSSGIPPTAPEHEAVGGVFDIGFQDIDGFAENDIYAVGGKGDVWHYDGARWRACDFPSNWPLFTVCCAPDGHVYITGEGGTIFQGRRDTWRRIVQDEITVPYNDSLWFQGKLWLASDYRLSVLEGNSVTRPNYKGKPVPIFGHMDVSEGLLVVASPETVRLYDGTTWRLLVGPQ